LITNALTLIVYESIFNPSISVNLYQRTAIQPGLARVEKCVFGRGIEICADKNTTRMKPSPLDEQQYNTSLHQEEKFHNMQQELKDPVIQVNISSTDFESSAQQFKECCVKSLIDYTKFNLCIS
jgi:hypothetical protein